jgi:hypothetical protein
VDERRDYSLIFLRILAVAAFGVAVLVVYWTVATHFPDISILGWIAVLAYAAIAFVVPTIAAPYLSAALKTTDYIAWRIAMSIWIAVTAVAWVLSWPIVGPYIRPIFIHASYVG